MSPHSAEAGVSTDHFGGFDDAYFRDVLDARFDGPTEADTQVSGAFGVKLLRDKVTATVKVINRALAGLRRPHISRVCRR
ncbi:MAG: hypothetical protein ABIS29_11235 [Vicinamibacterales bacterium]